jgi:glyoxylase I family protein
MLVPEWPGASLVAVTVHGAIRGGMLPVARLTHVGICVSDLERSLHFYRDLLGFTREHELEVEGEPTDTLLRLRGTKLHAEYLVRDGVRIELLHFASPPAPPRPARPINQYGLTHLSFRVTEMDAVLDGLRAAGESVLEDTIVRFPEWQSAACFVFDPDGQLIELVQSPGDPAVPPRA